MSQASVTIEHLSKRYQIGAARKDYTTLRERIARAGRRDEARVKETELWALRDVTFDIAEGEALGIIGHNGAGKSTLLKILSRITEPTEGRAILRGRVASLLEVGTGFHPELTGRENIYLNGAILGMTRAEIRRNFDAIVAFAEIDRFLDTPVKRYSSGMFVRLAFAVAAHLTPEILIVDEVLAVGDMEFQRRCLGRMNEVARSGRTVLFVSHNLGAIERLCTRAVLMRRGTVAKMGPTHEVVSFYLSERADASGSTDLRNVPDREGTGRVCIVGIDLLSDDGKPLDVVKFRSSFRIRMHYEANERVPSPFIGIAVLDEHNERVFLTNTIESGLTLEAIEAGKGHCDCSIPQANLLPGIYYLEAWITDEERGEFADHVRMVGKFEIVVGDDAREKNLSWLTVPDRGYIWLDAKWSVHETERT